MCGPRIGLGAAPTHRTPMPPLFRNEKAAQRVSFGAGYPADIHADIPADVRGQNLRSGPRNPGKTSPKSQIDPILPPYRDKLSCSLKDFCCDRIGQLQNRKAPEIQKIGENIGKLGIFLFSAIFTYFCPVRYPADLGTLLKKALMNVFSGFAWGNGGGFLL